MKTRNKILMIIGLMFACMVGYGQDTTYSGPRYVIKGNKLEKVEAKGEQPVKTSWTIDIKGIEYPVWKGTKGSYFVIRTSKKTGKEYRQYLKIEGLKD